MDIRQAYEKFGFTLIPSGTRFKMLCPFVPEKTPSFVIYEDLSFHCFSCQAHGTYKDFLEMIGEGEEGSYLFQSPDTIEEKAFLDVDKLKKELDMDLHLRLDDGSFEVKDKAWRAFDEIWLDLKFQNDLTLLETAMFIRKSFKKIVEKLN